MTRDDAVQTLQRFSKMFEAVQAIAAEIDSVQALERLAGEAQQRLNDKRGEVDAASAELAGVESAIERARADLAGVAAEAAQMREQAANDVKLSRAKAAKIVDDANAKASQLVSAAEQIVAAKQSHIAEIGETLAAMDGEATRKKHELAGLDEKIAQARATMAQFVAQFAGDA